MSPNISFYATNTPIRTGTDVIIAILSTSSLTSRRDALESQVRTIIDQLSADSSSDFRFSLVEIRGGSNTYNRNNWTSDPVKAKADLLSFAWGSTSNTGYANTALNNLYQHFDDPTRNKHILLITDTDYRKDPNYKTAVDSIENLHYNTDIALSVASTLPNRYSDYYYVERTGGISVDLRGNFTNAVCNVIKNPINKATGPATIVLQGGQIIELSQYPNSLDTTDTDGDGLADSEELVQSDPIGMDFTVAYQHYMGKSSAGVSVMIPVFAYTSNPVLESTAMDGILDSAKPQALRTVSLANVMVFVPDRRITEFGFKEVKIKGTKDKVLTTGSTDYKTSSLKGFKSLFVGDQYILNENVFVFNPKTNEEIDFDEFMDDVTDSLYGGAKANFITNGSGVELVQAYHDYNEDSVGNVFAVDKKKKTTPIFISDHSISDENVNSYYIFPKTATTKVFTYLQMKELILNGDASLIAPWEVDVTFEVSSDLYDAKKRKVTTNVGDTKNFSVHAYPWFAKAEYTINLTSAKQTIVQIYQDYNGYALTSLNSGKKKAQSKVNWVIESSVYAKKGQAPKSGFIVIVTGGFGGGMFRSLDWFSKLPNYISYFTDSEKTMDVDRGIMASLVKAAIDQWAIFGFIAVDIASIFTTDSALLYHLQSNVKQKSDIPVKYIESLVTYMDAYYLGRMIGDTIIMGVGFGESFIGGLIFTAGVLTGTAGAAGGGTIVMVLAPALSLVATGSITVAAGIKLSTYGSKNLMANAGNFFKVPKMANKGSSGRTIPKNLDEQIAMKQVKSNPLSGAKELPFTMGDDRWPNSEGWVKMANNVSLNNSNIDIHFVYNKKLNLVDDFKFAN